MLASCSAVDVAWRQTFAVALNQGFRPGELKALTWGDVDFGARIIHVTKAFDEKTKTAKTTKTGDQRVVSIRPALLPRLDRLRGEGRSPVAPLLSL